tara:strand:+ start:382 stop:564 length:183 start_codon:yes stop_codon:yes gene_type:complete
MKTEEVQKLVKLRKHIIDFYNNLDEKHSSASIMNTRQTAHHCETVINSLDELLKEYVKFQ